MAVGPLLAGMLAASAMSNCSGPLRVSADVVSAHGPVETADDFPLAQLRDMAKRVGRTGKHEPLGFYSATLAHSISVNLDTRDADGCLTAVIITVRLALIDRHVEIAKELTATPCMFALARDHYARHAAADDAILTRFSRKLGAALQTGTFPMLQGDPGSADQDRETIQQMIEQQVDRLSEARSRERDEVDTPAEVAKLRAGCGA